MFQIMVQVELRLVTRDDAAIVLSVLNGAAAWLSSRGIQQWASQDARSGDKQS